MQALLNVITRLQKIDNQEQHSGIKSGFNLLDELLNGFRKGNLYIIAGQQLIGKTAFLISLLNNIIHTSDGKAGIISVDISEERMVERILSNLSEVRLEVINRGKLQEHEKRILNNSSLLNDFDKIKIAGNDYINIESIANVCSNWVQNENVKIIFIDCLQLISTEVTENKELRNIIITESLKTLAVNLDVPIVATIALNGTSDVYSLDELRKIGSIESFADVIMFLNKLKQAEDKFRIEEEEVHLSIAKNNTGLLDTIRLRALLHIQKLVEFDY